MQRFLSLGSSSEFVSLFVDNCLDAERIFYYGVSLAVIAVASYSSLSTDNNLNLFELVAYIADSIGSGWAEFSFSYSESI